MQINVDNNLDIISRAMQKAARQVPFAAAVALNETALKVIEAERAVMRRVFDRPTAFTVESLRVERATKQTLAAVIQPKDAAAGGRSAASWLAPNIEGGARKEKGIERAMRAAGILPAGMSMVPAAGAKLDSFGNWRRAHMAAVLVDMRVAGIRAVKLRVGRAQAKDAARTRARQSKYFVVAAQAGGLEPGIYERFRSGFGAAVRPVAIFTDSRPRYRKRLPFKQVALRVANRSFPIEFQAAFERALATAR